MTKLLFIYRHGLRLSFTLYRMLAMHTLSLGPRH